MSGHNYFTSKQSNQFNHLDDPKKRIMATLSNGVFSKRG